WADRAARCVNPGALGERPRGTATRRRVAAACRGRSSHAEDPQAGSIPVSDDLRQWHGTYRRPALTRRAVDLAAKRRATAGPADDQSSREPPPPPPPSSLMIARMSDRPWRRTSSLRWLRFILAARAARDTLPSCAGRSSLK